MKTLIIVVFLSVAAYSSVGALMKSVEIQKNYADKTSEAMKLIK